MIELVSAEIPHNVALPTIPQEAPQWLRRYLGALHQAINRNQTHIAQAFTILNTYRLLVGPLADRPAATGAKIIYVTTESEPHMYVDSVGATWDQVL